MKVTCEIVAMAFGPFYCCPPACHEPVIQRSVLEEFQGICCTAERRLNRNGVSVFSPITHPKLLKAIQDNER